MLCSFQCETECVNLSVMSESLRPHQAPLSMRFSRQEYWSGLPCPPPGDLPNPGIKPRSPILWADSLPSEPTGKPIYIYIYMSDSVRPHRWQPTRLPHPWDSPGKNTGVACHFLLQCMKVTSESEVTQSCPTPSNPMGCSPPGSGPWDSPGKRTGAGCHCPLHTYIYIQLYIYIYICVCVYIYNFIYIFYFRLFSIIIYYKILNIVPYAIQ